MRGMRQLQRPARRPVESSIYMAWLVCLGGDTALPQTPTAPAKAADSRRFSMHAITLARMLHCCSVGARDMLSTPSLRALQLVSRHMMPCPSQLDARAAWAYR